MNFLKYVTATALFAGVSFTGSSALAQQASVGIAKQQGNGAFVAKENTVQCYPNALVASLTGVSNLPAGGCTNFTALRYNITPSGNSKSAQRGVLPEGSRPSQTTTYNSTYTEHVAGPTFGKVYDTVAVIEPDGTTTITTTLKGNGQGNDQGNDQGKGKGKGKSKK